MDEEATTDLPIIDQFYKLYYESRFTTWENTHWLGRRIAKNPLDLWVYQEILYELRPDLIVETGTSNGGSALWFASMCDLLGRGEIVTIDLVPQTCRPEHPRITYLTGSSTSDEIVRQVRERAKGNDVVLVVLDSNHHKADVLTELAAYAPLVTSGSYLIVEGTSINDRPVHPQGPGPAEAVTAFLEKNPEFIPDRSREKFKITFNLGGYLKRLPAPPMSAAMQTAARISSYAETTDQDASGPSGAARDLYFDIMKKCLTRTLFSDDSKSSPRTGQTKPINPSARAVGRGRPAEAETMIGLRRMENIEYCISDVLRRGVPGDLIETGVWRGGATIFMRAVLAAHGDDQRTVWVADSFAGLPAPNAELYPADAESKFHQKRSLAIPLEEVKANFARYGLLDGQVEFLVGWFKDTLPDAPIERLAVARLDGDMYESTMDAMRALYPKLSIGGYLIVDDYGAIRGCRKAVDDYRREHGIDEPIVQIDWTGVYWQKTGS